MEMIFLISILKSSIVASVLILFLLLIFKFTNNIFSAKTRYFIWIIVILSLIIPARPKANSTLITVNPALITNNSIKKIETLEQNNEEKNIYASDNISSDSAQTKNNKIHISPIFLVWFIIAISTFSYRIIKYKKFRKFVERWGYKPDDKLLKLFDEVKSSLGLQNKNIALIKCPHIKTPMLIGVIKQVIVIPENYINYDEAELIFKHELTHYIHKDLFINLLSIIAISIHWFNPIIYICFFNIQTDCEAYCDEDVLSTKDTDYRRFYGELIISMIEYGNNSNTALSTCFYYKKNNIKRRLVSIMNTKKSLKKLSTIAITTVLGITLSSNFLISFANSNYIGVEKAKSIALQDSGLKSADVTFTEAKLDNSNKNKDYDIEFISGDKKYDYDIDAISGKILEKSSKIKKQPVSTKTTNQKKSTNQNTENKKNVNKTTSNVNTTKDIGKENAKSIAIKDAGVKASDITFIKVKLDIKKTGNNEYDIEFHDNTMEYEYEIDAVSGKILEKSIEPLDD